MNGIDFSQAGGFPLDQDVFAFQQENIALLQRLANMAGPRAILDGLVIGGGIATPGYVVIDGEVLPMQGGPVQAKVSIKEVLTDMQYEDGSLKPVQKERYAIFGDDGSTTILWADFVRVPTMGLIKKIADLENYAASLDADLAIAEQDIVNLKADRIKRLASGSIHLENADSNNSTVGLGTTQVIPIGKVLPTTNYQVLLTVISHSINPQKDLYHHITIRAKLNNAFHVYFREADVNVQDITLDWTIIEI